MKRDLQPCQFGRRASAARLASTAGAALIAAAVSVGSAQGQTVTLAQGVDPESLDPALDTLITSVGVMMNIYDSLVWRDADGNIVPGLAESWEFPEPDRMELTLRQGVTFHNGEPFNADDVVFSYQRLFDEDNPSPLLTSLRGFVDSVEKVDDYTVAVNMPGPRATVVPNSSGDISPPSAHQPGRGAWKMLPTGKPACRCIASNPPTEAAATVEPW